MIEVLCAVAAHVAVNSPVSIEAANTLVLCAREPPFDLAPRNFLAGILGNLLAFQKPPGGKTAKPINLGTFNRQTRCIFSFHDFMSGVLVEMDLSLGQ